MTTASNVKNVNHKLDGRQSWRLLWGSSRGLSLGVLGWAAADAVDGPLVVAALGVVVGAIPAAVTDGLSSPAGRRLIGALIVAALLYTASLILDPIGGALATAAHQRLTGAIQGRLLSAVTGRPASRTWRIRTRWTGWPPPKGR